MQRQKTFHLQRSQEAGLRHNCPVTTPRLTSAAAAIALAVVVGSAGCNKAVEQKQAKAEPIFNKTDVTNVLDFMNNRPVPPGAFRILFIGDSLTMHEPSHELWDNFKGMAATTSQNDFVHLATAAIQQRLGSRPAEAFYDNGGKGKIGPMLEYATAHADLKPDLIVLQGGENDPLDETFRNTYAELLKVFPGTPRVVLGDWNSREKSKFEQQQTSAAGIQFIDLTEIHQDPANSGDGGPYRVAGVAAHPNDNGMKAIAGKIIGALDTLWPAVEAKSKSKR